MDEDAMRELWLSSIPQELRSQRIPPKVQPMLQCIDCGKAFERRSTARRCKSCQSRFDHTARQRQKRPRWY
jgi:rRNA maturation endonuclease Nob1